MAGLADAAAVLSNGHPGRQVHYFDSVDSTNRVARRLGQEGAAAGTIVVAGSQTAGRGRRRRPWVSPPGVGIYVSLLLRPGFPALESGSAVQLIAGIAAAEALAARLPVAPALRWPNDCFAAGRKIAGVLVEAETTRGGFDFLVCGIGINVNHEAADFPEELRERATSLKLQLGHRVPRLAVLVTLLDAFDAWETVWRTHGLGPVCGRWLELSPESSGGRVAVQTEEGTITGAAAGLSDAGLLRVETADGVHEISVGEVVKLRPA